MIGATDCLARAAEMDERAVQCGGASARASYLRIASGWRRVSLMARHQEQWLAPDEAPA
jgi:hypothetical protein